ncbi:MAG TPA: hypothetical protein VGZ27_03545 [Vicinamibacterales bacterium]|jgi:predicted dienelactone hydrolase|nr:hypothetical protein [Vicinamibacterales bacterium]
MTRRIHPLALTLALTLGGGLIFQDCALLALGGTHNLVLRDAARDRDVPVKVYDPSRPGASLLILFSPGFGGSKDGYEYLGRGWSDAGYVVVIMTHLGSDQEAVRRYGASLSRDPRASFTLQVDRTTDVAFVLDSLDLIEQQIPALRGRISRQRIGVAGHSMGAGTALLVAGARAAPPAGALRTFRDPRVTAAIAMSPQGAGEEGFTEASWNDLRVPVMTMSGTLDLGIAGQPATWRLEPFQHMPPVDKFQVIVDGARHLSFATGERFHPCILKETLAFWESFLKQDKPSRISSFGACAVTSK